jgi:Holliday junction resolvasome RuvABC endonuclease subunit
MNLGRNGEGLQLQNLVYRVGREYAVDIVATERPFTGHWDKRPRVGMAQREKQGLVRAACEALQVPLVDYQPRTIRAAFGVKAKGAAGKVQVARCVQLLVVVDNPRGPMSEHVADACALAFVALTRERADRRLAVLGIKPQPRRARRARRVPA